MNITAFPQEESRRQTDRQPTKTYLVLLMVGRRSKMPRLLWLLFRAVVLANPDQAKDDTIKDGQPSVRRWRIALCSQLLFSLRGSQLRPAQGFYVHAAGTGWAPAAV